MRKKGEMTSKQLLTIILSLVGFALVLFLYFQLSGVSMVNREVCHESVVFRGTAAAIPGAQDLISLKCKTRKVCITDKVFGKGDCEDELGKNYDTVRISSSKDKQEQEINMFMARELADCWSMMGEGKLQVFKRDIVTLNTAKRKCVICSKIAFDESIKREKQEINGFGNYIITRKIPNNDETYWEFLTNSKGSNNLFTPNGESLNSIDSFNLDQKAIVFIESDKSYLGSLLGASAGAVTGAVLGSYVPVVGTGVGFLAGAAIGGGLIGGKLGGKIQDSVKGFEGNYVSGISLTDYSNEAIRELECDSLENIP